jgi:hypothetical protein
VGCAGSRGATTIALRGTGLLFVPTLLMIVFRQKYPRWWFDWKLQLLRFGNRVGAYLALTDDHYPSTEEEQAVHLDFAYPDAEHDLNRCRSSNGCWRFPTTSCSSSSPSPPSSS